MDERDMNQSIHSNESERMTSNQDAGQNTEPNQTGAGPNAAPSSAEGRAVNWNGSEYGWKKTQPPYPPEGHFSGGNTGRPEEREMAYSSSDKKEKKKKSGRGAVAALLLCGILFGGGAGFGGAYLFQRFFHVENSSIVPGGQNTDPNRTTVIYRAVSDGNVETVTSQYTEVAVASAASPSVAEVRTEKVVTGSFYGQYVSEGAGSGVILSEDGYILTCAHVVDGATNVNVILKDGTTCPASIVGSDSATDVAVLKIEKTGLTSAVIGNSDELSVGEPAIAIGNPLGTLGGSVSSGIISALGRQIEIDGYYYTLLQTTAPINPGNSGGGLFNSRGELIGLVNAKYASEQLEGLGFAIPINSVMEIAEMLMKDGYVSGRPSLGISVVQVTASNVNSIYSSEYRSLMNYVTQYGVYFIDYAGSQTRGDLKYGDLITAIDGTVISSMNDIKMLLYYGDYKIGDKVTLTVARIDENNSSSRRVVTKQVQVELTLIESEKGK